MAEKTDWSAITIPLSIAFVLITWEVGSTICQIEKMRLDFEKQRLEKNCHCNDKQNK